MRIKVLILQKSITIFIYLVYIIALFVGLCILFDILSIIRFLFLILERNNMKNHKLKSIFFGIIILLSALTFTACDSNDKSGSTSVKSDSASEHSDLTSEPTNSDSTYDDDASNSVDNWHRDNESINWVREKFNITLPVVTADEALNMVKLNLPTQNGGCSGYYVELIDENIFIVELLDKGEKGLYNIESNEYSSLPGIGEGEICAYNRDYTNNQLKT